MVNLELSQKTRYILLRLIPVAVLIVFVARLVYVNVVEADGYIAMANKMRIASQTLKAKRGEIFMRSGVNGGITPLVMNERVWNVYVDPYYIKENGDIAEVQSSLIEVMGDKVAKVDWGKVWKDISIEKQYYPIASNVEWNIVSKLKEKNLVGVGMQEDSRRVYPQETLAAQVVGFVNAEGVGSGLEGSLGDSLKGTDGTRKYVRDVRNVPLSIGEENTLIPAKNGTSYVLTLDENIQRKAEAVLKKTVDNSGGAAKSASVLVMNPNNGEVFAMANYPTFDPANYSQVKDASVYINRTTASIYEPASVCKPFTYAMAINEGKLDPTESFYNYGYTKVGDRTVKNATGTENQVGRRTFYEALNHSLNTGSIEALRRIGGENIPKTARVTMYDYLYNRFRLGQKTGVELYEEQGKIYSPDESEGNAVRYSNMTFGQGMSLTMVQTAAGFSSVINGGKYYKPTIIAGTMEDEKFKSAGERKPEGETISAVTSATMRGMLQEVRSVNGGKADLPGYNVGVKTGTAETYDDRGNYTSNRTIVGAIGYGGSAKEGELPAYVILVRIDGNTLLWGVSNAVPVFTELSNYMLEYLRIEPVK